MNALFLICQDEVIASQLRLNISIYFTEYLIILEVVLDIELIVYNRYSTYIYLLYVIMYTLLAILSWTLLTPDCSLHPDWYTEMYWYYVVGTYDINVCQGAIWYQEIFIHELWHLYYHMHLWKNDDKESEEFAHKFVEFFMWTDIWRNFLVKHK